MSIMRPFFSIASVIKRISSAILFNKSKMTPLPKVFVKHIEEDQKLKICFSFALGDFSAKSFTFLRPVHESLETSISRMQLKIRTHFVEKSRKGKKRKNPQETLDINSEDFPLSITLMKERQKVSPDITNDDAWTSEAQVIINDKTYEIIRNPPAVNSLALPKSILCGFPVYPRLELEFCSKEDCIFSWFRLTKGKWEKIGDGFLYITSVDDIDCKLKVVCVPQNNGITGPAEEAESSNVVLKGPGKLPFEYRNEWTKKIASHDRLRCVSYNILADFYADSETGREMFSYCSPDALALDYRKQLFIKEILGYQGDIVCLQETDRGVFHADLQPALKDIGLDGLYCEKAQVREGLACFYRTSKYRLIESQCILLSEAVASEPFLQSLHSKICENEKLKERFMGRSTTLQLVLLESLHYPGRRLLVGNTHLYFHPESDNIRLLQASACIKILEQAKVQHQNQGRVDVVLCGDFNSCPEFGVFELMTKGSLGAGFPAWKSNADEAVDGMDLSHSLRLSSACGTPDYTNYTIGFYGCLDYIFSSLPADKIVPLPSHEDVTKHGALPSPLFPSDHIALVCELRLDT